MSELIKKMDHTPTTRIPQWDANNCRKPDVKEAIEDIFSQFLDRGGKYTSYSEKGERGEVCHGIKSEKGWSFQKCSNYKNDYFFSTERLRIVVDKDHAFQMIRFGEIGKYDYSYIFQLLGKNDSVTAEAVPGCYDSWEISGVDAVSIRLMASAMKMVGISDRTQSASGWVLPTWHDASTLSESDYNNDMSLGRVKSRFE